MGTFINTSLNNISIRSRLVSLPTHILNFNNEHHSISTDRLPILFLKSLGTTGKNWNSNKQVHTIKTSIIHKDIQLKRHKILKQNKNKWCTIVRTLSTSPVTELELKRTDLNHTAEIYTRCHLIDK